jgi:tetratricopeptide (TPR) repeat protein
VNDWVERGLYAQHNSHVAPAVCNAEHVEGLTSVDGGKISLPGLRGVFCNYVLDVLPCALVRHDNDVIEELNIRTYLTSDATLLAQHTPLSPGEIQALSHHTRLITSRSLPATEQIFNARFSAESINAFDAPAQQARSANTNGNHAEALDRYREAIEQQPRNWRLLGEIAEFLLFEIKDASAALELAQRAVELNPSLKRLVMEYPGRCAVDARKACRRPHGLYGSAAN